MYNMYNYSMYVCMCGTYVHFFYVRCMHISTYTIRDTQSRVEKGAFLSLLFIV